MADDNPDDLLPEGAEPEDPTKEEFSDVEIDDIFAALDSARKNTPFSPPEVGANDPRWMLSDGSPYRGHISRVEGKKVYAIHNSDCWRCGGRGGSNHWPGYTCFKCGGNKTFREERRVYTTDQVEAFRQAKRRRIETLAAKKREEAAVRQVAADERAIGARAEHAELFELMERIDLERKDKFAASVLATFRLTGTLSDPQTAALRKAADRLITHEFDARRSEHVGRTGKRYEGEGECLRFFTFDGFRGSYVHFAKLRDPRGNIVVLKASRAFEFEVGDTVQFVGTVKEHAHRRGTDETVLFRVKVPSFQSRRELDRIAAESATVTLPSEPTEDDADIPAHSP